MIKHSTTSHLTMVSRSNHADESARTAHCAEQLQYSVTGIYSGRIQPMEAGEEEEGGVRSLLPATQPFPNGNCTAQSSL